MLRKPSELGKPDPLPQPASSGSSTGSSVGGFIQQLLGFALIVVVCFLLYDRFGSIDRGDGRGDDQHHQQDDKKQGDDKQQKLVAKPGWLHVVRERQTPPEAEQESVAKLFDLVDGWKKAGGLSLEMRDTDDDEPSAPVRKMVDYAKSKGIDPPFLLYKTLDNELKGVIKLPAPTASESQFLEVFK